MYLLPSGAIGKPDNISTEQCRAEHQSVPFVVYHAYVSVDPCTERKSRIPWSSESHLPSYMANSKPTVVVERYVALPSGLLTVPNGIDQRVASATDAAQPFVQRRCHTTYELTYHRTNERQDTAPKISCL